MPLKLNRQEKKRPENGQICKSDQGRDVEVNEFETDARYHDQEG